MSELIERQKAFYVLSEYYHHVTGLQHMALQEALDLVPAADIPERKKGTWYTIEDSNGVYYSCSRCGKALPRYSQVVSTELKSIDKTAYCPNCGSYMKIKYYIELEYGRPIDEL